MSEFNISGKTAKEVEKYSDALERFEYNFKILFREVDRRKTLAELERTRESASQKVQNAAQSFFDNHPNGANREDVVEFLDKLEALLLLDDRFDAAAIKRGIEALRKDYKLNINLGERVENYGQFKTDVQRLKDLGKKESEKGQEADEVSSSKDNLASPKIENPVVATSSLVEDVENKISSSPSDSKAVDNDKKTKP